MARIKRGDKDLQDLGLQILQTDQKYIKYKLSYIIAYYKYKTQWVKFAHAALLVIFVFGLLLVASVTDIEVFGQIIKLAKALGF